MRAISLIVNEDGQIKEYDFLRVDGSDYENATYRLLLKLDGGFHTIRDFQGTMEQNAKELSSFFRNKKNSKIIDISGDFDLKQIVNNDYSR